ncbi:MAG: tRNA threonylcarbamoyladenosine dehydratase [Clostridia bacterium]|nr:tRNA threonylcarbamoyladenosine dehydratase [Clostridia bacterium]
MINQFSRSEILYGKEGIEKLKRARVAVFGVGGVGGYTVEALARSGVGTLDIIDSDKVSLSNINRQIIATYKTIGMPKVEAMADRVKDICPDTVVNKYEKFYLPENAEEFDLSVYDYVVDAVDTVSAKIELALQCEKLGVPLISSMGAGNKVDPTAFEITDIYKTSVCPLAKVMRYELKKRGIKKLKVVYSKEVPITRRGDTEETKGGKPAPGSTSFVPSAVGLIIASKVVNDLTGFERKD